MCFSSTGCILSAVSVRSRESWNDCVKCSSPTFSVLGWTLRTMVLNTSCVSCGRDSSGSRSMKKSKSALHDPPHAPCSSVSVGRIWSIWRAACTCRAVCSVIVTITLAWKLSALSSGLTMRWSARVKCSTLARGTGTCTSALVRPSSEQMACAGMGGLPFFSAMALKRACIWGTRPSMASRKARSSASKLATIRTAASGGGGGGCAASGAAMAFCDVSASAFSASGDSRGSLRSVGSTHSKLRPALSVMVTKFVREAGRAVW
mmetsp:Transcript_3411/g.7520  ORF Transcript_3411/g.7520 Transcript_3411/m.7520 type:complete len:262 (-) Transcript_3411:164-949(-)